MTPKQEISVETRSGSSRGEKTNTHDEGEGTQARVAKPTILERRIQSKKNQNPESSILHLLFLGCEANPPYGPFLHTATLFLDLMEQAVLQKLNDDTSSAATRIAIVRLEAYQCSLGEFPEPSAFEACHGVILPGSFSSAYDTDPWILQLRNLIQDELVANERPTLGVCFGHQVYAHSFDTGKAVRCPVGPQAGRQTSNLSEVGRQLLGGAGGHSFLDMFYTHGDMVELLPPQGTVLGGTETVPIQSAIYHSKSKGENDHQARVVAITFQAHPEYASTQTLGVSKTLTPILETLWKRGDISEDRRMQAEQDSLDHFQDVQKQSIRTMVTVGQLLGWFPSTSP